MVKVGGEMKKILFFISLISIFIFLIFLHHEQSLAFGKRKSIDSINSEIFVNYEKFENVIEKVRCALVSMQDFFESDPSMIPEIYDKYYLVLSNISNNIFELEKYGLELQGLCNDLGEYSNKVCFVYSGNILEVNNNYDMVIKKFNNVILKYNDISLSSYEVFR